jgi:nucleotide-binding universal stress UspA family protein
MSVHGRVARFEYRSEEFSMKILIPVDGSPCSDAAVAEVARRPWPEGSQIKVLFVIHSHFPNFPDPVLFSPAAHFESLAHERKIAGDVVDKATSTLREGNGSHGLEIVGESAEGVPKELILDEAERWGADLAVLGSHGRGAVKRFLLGSVSHAVAEHAQCSVELVRCTHLPSASSPGPLAQPEPPHGHSTPLAGS